MTLLILFGAAGCRQRAETTGGKAVDPDTGKSIAVRVSPEDTDTAEPAIAADKNGNIFTLYVAHYPDKTADLYLQASDRDLRPAGEKVRINPKPGTAKAWRGDPPTIVIGGDIAIYVGWTAQTESGDREGNDLLLSVSHDGGKTFGEPVKVDDDIKPASHGMHSLALGREGQIYMAWLDERNKPAHSEHKTGAHMSMMLHEEEEPNSEVFYAVSVDGGKTFSPNRKLAHDVCPCCKTSLLAASDAAVYASWRQVLPGDLRHIAVASSADGGKTFSDAVIVSNDQWQINACPVSGAALVSGADHTLDISWYTAGTAGQAGVYTARSTDGGRTFGPRVLASNEATSGTPVMLNKTGNSSFLIFSGVGEKVTMGDWQNSPPALLKKATYDEAAAPAATLSNTKPVVAFVRSTNQNSSVWLTRYD